MANEITFDISDAVKELGGLGGRIVDAAKAALYQEAQSIMSESKGLVPVDTGVLRASGSVDRPIDDGRTVSVTLGYGGAASEYAERVHEDLYANHVTGQAKFLEVPLILREPELVHNVEAHIKAAAER